MPRAALVLGLAVLGGGLLVLLGGTPVLLVGATWAAVALTLLPWAGAALAFAGSVVFVAGWAFALLLLSGALGGHLVAVQTLGLSAVGLGATLVGWLRPRPLDLAPARARLALLGSLAGPVVWIGGLVRAGRIDSSYAIAWVMSGDARANVLHAREMLAAGGIQPAQLKGAALTQAFLAAVMGPGRDGMAGLDLLLHDLGRVAQAWSLFIMAGCLFTGLLAGLLTRPETPVTRLVASAGASLLPLGWFVLGPALENGFTNVSVALMFTAVSWVIVARSDRKPAVAALGLATATALLLATWYPMAVLSTSLLGVVLWLWTRQPGHDRRARGVLVVLTGGAGLAVAGMVALPLISSRIGTDLAMEGGIYPLSYWAFPLAAGLALALAASASAEPTSRTLLWACALAMAGTGAMLGVLLYVRHQAEVPRWGYYAIKYAWMLGSAFSFLLAALLAAAASRAPSAATRAAAVLGAGAALVALSNSLTVVAGSKAPVRFVLDGWGGPNGIVVDQVIDSAERGPDRVLWSYYDAPNDRIGNFWLALAASDRPDTLGWALGYDPASLGALCQLGDAGPITAVTRDPGLADSLHDACPESSVTVETIG